MPNQRGLSLVELMISITLGLLLMAGVVRMFVSSNTVFSSQQSLSRVQETGRLAMEFIGRDLRIASSAGCINTAAVLVGGDRRVEDPVGPSLTGLHSNFTQGLVGYTVSVHPTTHVVSGLPSGVSLGSGFTLADNSDVLVIRGANDRGMAILSVNNETKVFGYTNQSLVSGCVEGFCQNGIAVISNCRNGRIFQISDVPNVQASKVTLSHSDSWDIATPSKDLYENGNILPFHTIVYFVATSDTPVGNTTPSLWQQIDGGTPVEILQGVERVGFQYMAKPTRSQQVPVYVNASAVADWDSISSVQAEIVVRGDNQFELQEKQTYVFRGGTVEPAATDRYSRKVFRASFSLRSRNP